MATAAMEAGSGAGRASRRSGGERRQGTFTNLNEEQLARGLAWFSLGLGLAEVLAPRAVAKIAGVREGRDNDNFIRLMGLREIAHGVAIFMQGKRPAEAVWARVAGDALDLAALGAAFTSEEASKARLAFATANVLAVTALDVLCARQLSAQDETVSEGAALAKKSIVVNCTPEEAYRYWRDFEKLPTFMKHLEQVSVTGERRSHWVAKAPAGTVVGWDAEITEDRPNELIAWRSLEGADVDNSGTVRFERAAGDRGTIITVEIDYSPPAGVLGALAAKLFGEEPAQQMQDDLRRFKQVIEVGEVVISDGTVFDNGVLTQRPAQPPAREELKGMAAAQ